MAAGLLAGTIVMMASLMGFLAVAKRRGWLDDDVSSEKSEAEDPT